MKNIITLFLIVVIALACEKNNTVVVSGKITNPDEKVAVFRINYFDRVDTVTVNSDETFLTEIDLEEEHLGKFIYQNQAFPLYLEPGGYIILALNTEDLKNEHNSNMIISGKKSETTLFLNSLDYKWKGYNWPEILKMPLDSFIQFAREVENEIIDELEDFKRNNSLSQKFVEIVNLRNNVMMVSGIKYYTIMNQQNNTQILSDFLKEFTDKIPLDNEEKCKEIDEYKYYLTQYYQDNINEKMKASGLYKETSAYINRLADEIISLNAPQVVKDDIADWMFSVFYKRPDSLRQIYRARYKDVVKNEEYLHNFEKIADARDRLISGNTAPTFNYPDINGEMVSLESFMGKVVYIDVWATWCGPCIAEFPYLKKLQNELNNEEIAFVSISIDSEKDKESWKMMVKEKELGGYQLYAKGEWESKIATDYVIRGIPYFIIIDKDGKLVEVFATRPSDPETKEKLINLARS